MYSVCTYNVLYISVYTCILIQKEREKEEKRVEKANSEEIQSHLEIESNEGTCKYMYMYI